jgi:hypothetical protein
MRRTTHPLTLTAGLFALAACSDGAGPGQPGVGLSFATRPAAAVPAPGLSASVMGADTLEDGANTLIITRAEIVLREIELERVDGDDCEAAVNHDDCQEFEAGPILLDLPLGPGAEQAVLVQVPVGSYDEIDFEIHQVSTGDQEDAAFRTQYPHMAGKSIRVEGNYNGTPFVFESDLDVEQEFDLAPPLEVTDTTATNITVRLDITQWFRAQNGSYLDPADGNVGGRYESLIKENIKQSVEAFEDHDGDGDHSDED